MAGAVKSVERKEREKTLGVWRVQEPMTGGGGVIEGAFLFQADRHQ